MAQGPRTKLPTGAQVFDRGVEKGRTEESDRILARLRRFRDAHDEELERAAWEALDEAMRAIEAK